MSNHKLTIPPPLLAVMKKAAIITEKRARRKQIPIIRLQRRRRRPRPRLWWWLPPPPPPTNPGQQQQPWQQQPLEEEDEEEGWDFCKKISQNYLHFCFFEASNTCLELTVVSTTVPTPPPPPPPPLPPNSLPLIEEVAEVAPSQSTVEEDTFSRSGRTMLPLLEEWGKSLFKHFRVQNCCCKVTCCSSLPASGSSASSSPSSSFFWPPRQTPPMPPRRKRRPFVRPPPLPPPLLRPPLFGGTLWSWRQRRSWTPKSKQKAKDIHMFLFNLIDFSMFRTCLSKAVFFPPSTTATSGIPPCTSPPPPSEYSLVSWCPAMLASAAAAAVDEGRKDSISRAKLTDSPDHIFEIGALVFFIAIFLLSLNLMLRQTLNRVHHLHNNSAFHRG